MFAAVERDNAAQLKWRKRRVAEVMELYGIDVRFCAREVSVSLLTFSVCLCLSLSVSVNHIPAQGSISLRSNIDIGRMRG